MKWGRNDTLAYGVVMDAGNKLRAAYDEGLAADAAKAASTQTDNLGEFDQFGDASKAAEAIGGKTEWNEGSKAYDIKDSDGSTIQSFTPAGLKYTANGQTQDTEFSKNKLRGFGLRAAGDSWMSLGNEKRASYNYDQADQMQEKDDIAGERANVIAERKKNDEFKAKFGIMQGHYAAGSKAITEGRWDDEALKPMIDSFNTQGSGWMDDGRTGELIKGPNGLSVAFTDANGVKSAPIPVSRKDALAAWNNYKQNELDAFYRQHDPVKSYERDLSAEAEARKAAILADRENRKDKRTELAEDRRDERLHKTLAARFGDSNEPRGELGAGGGSRGSSGTRGGGSSILKTAKEWNEAIDSENVVAPEGMDANAFRETYRTTAAQLLKNHFGGDITSQADLEALKSTALRIAAAPGQTKDGGKVPPVIVSYQADDKGRWSQTATTDDGRTYIMSKNVPEGQVRASMQKMSKDGKLSEDQTKQIATATLNATGARAEEATKIRSDPKIYQEALQAYIKNKGGTAQDFEDALDDAQRQYAEASDAWRAAHPEHRDWKNFRSQSPSGSETLMDKLSAVGGLFSAKRGDRPVASMLPSMM